VSLRQQRSSLKYHHVFATVAKSSPGLSAMWNALRCGSVCTARVKNNRYEGDYSMRKFITALSIAAVTAAALATPAIARPDRPYYPNVAEAEVATGAAVGTVAGVGLYNGWWGSGAAATSLGATAGAAAVAGGVAGIGSIALIDALVQPCRGFHALFGLNHGACANGEYVGYAPRHMR
jgi:hypothetical protein